MSDYKTDYKERLDITRMMSEPGEWNTTTNSRNNIVKTAVFDSFFSYLTLRADDAIMQLDFEIGPERILNEMLKRTEIEIMRSLANFKLIEKECDDEKKD